MTMDSVNRTLYIPLYGKALVSGQGIILRDPKAEAIWETAGFRLSGKAASKWLAYSMAMRAEVFDRWTEAVCEGSVVLHLGCGLDSRCSRVDTDALWYDLDFPEVIRERGKYFRETERYRMISGDLRQEQWKQHIPAGGSAVVILEGVSMYLKPEELEGLLKGLRSHFSSVRILMDCYSSFAARASKYRNPINTVGVTQVYGMDDPQLLAEKTGLQFLKEHSMTPTRLIRQLTTGERILFSNLYAGPLARSLYRLYEFKG